MSEERNPWQERFLRERNARKESEALLEEKSLELWRINQNLEAQVKERTESLQEALLKAENADRAKSDFLANMSHEIRTPLNAIIGFSQYLTNSEELSKQNSKYASIIESSATSLLSIINDILDFSKIESGNFEISEDECDVHDICDQVVELFSQKTSEKHIDLIYKFDEDIPRFIYTDGLRVKQVISNLLSNAIKFTPSHGKIYFSVKKLELINEEVLLKFKVEDTGIGIPEDKIESILNPFIQLEHIANKQNVGTGLGLSICNNILKLLGSEIEVSSEVGKGSIFEFSLLTKVIKRDELKKDILVENQNFLKGRILVAEDNSANQELMKLILTELNIDCTIANNGQEAFEIYKNDNSFDLILMDINMPVLNGVEALYKIRIYEEENSLLEVPIVALTANAIKGDKERFLSLGMNDYLSKPIEVPAFKRVASKYLKVEEESFIEVEKTLGINKSEIAKRIGVSENIVEMIVKKFESEIKKDIQELEVYIKNRDSENISSKAHYIKNSCLNVALDEVCSILEKMEQENLEFDKIEELYKELELKLKDFL